LVYDLTVQALDNRSGLGIELVNVIVEWIPPQEGLPGRVFQGTTDNLGIVKWSTSLEGLFKINATHPEYVEWNSVRPFSPANPLAQINLTNLIPPEKVRLVLTVLDAENGNPVSGVTTTVPFLPVPVTRVTDKFGMVAFDYWQGQARIYDVTFSKGVFIPLKVVPIDFPTHGGEGTVELDVLVFKDMSKEEKDSALGEAWDALPTNEKLAQSILVALSIIYGMRAIQGFSAARFKPI
jgi:hypothetical protein